MAGPRYLNYFPDTRNGSSFNREKYKRYICHLKAKGFLTLRNTRTSKNSENTELRGNVYMRNSRSRAGCICQPDAPDLVVSRVGLDILLSSVIRVRRLALNLAVFGRNRSFAGLAVRPEWSRIWPDSSQNESILARKSQYWPECVNNGQTGQYWPNAD